MTAAALALIAVALAATALWIGSNRVSGFWASSLQVVGGLVVVTLLFMVCLGGMIVGPLFNPFGPEHTLAESPDGQVAVVWVESPKSEREDAVWIRDDSWLIPRERLINSSDIEPTAYFVSATELVLVDEWFDRRTDHKLSLDVSNFDVSGRTDSYWCFP